jgi:transposase-like protein
MDTLLKKALKKAGSIAALAEGLGVSRTTVFRWVKKETKIRNKNRGKLIKWITGELIL